MGVISPKSQTKRKQNSFCVPDSSFVFKHLNIFGLNRRPGLRAELALGNRNWARSVKIPKFPKFPIGNPYREIPYRDFLRNSHIVIEGKNPYREFFSWHPKLEIPYREF